MRDRLIELLKSKSCRENLCMGKNCADCEYIAIFEGDAEKIVDYLLANGVIVPPCKVGDVVWRIEDVWHLDDKATWKYHYEKEVLEFMVRSISVSCNSKGVWTKKFRICEIKNGKIIDHQRNIEFVDFGKTVFLTREEAEQALKGGIE